MIYMKQKNHQSKRYIVCIVVYRGVALQDHVVAKATPEKKKKFLNESIFRYLKKKISYPKHIYFLNYYKKIFFF